MRSITYFRKTVQFPDKPEKKRFFARLQNGDWEPCTFQNIERLVDRKTTFIDIGGWIGVTPYWAAQIADNVITVEPDPVCFGILKEMQPENSGEVRVINAALSEDEVLVLHSVGGGFGSSETSALIADDDGEAIRAQTVTIGELQTMARTERMRLIRSLSGFRLDNPKAIWAALRKSIARREFRGFDLLFVSRQSDR